MSKQQRGPGFERSPDQRVVIGPYEPARPQPAPAPPTRSLLSRLKDRFSGTSANPGPSFAAPKGTKRIGRLRRREKEARRKASRQRPDFTDPTP